MLWFQYAHCTESSFTKQVVANGISFSITKFETVGYTLYMEAQQWIFVESFGYFSLKDTKSNTICYFHRKVHKLFSNMAG